MGNPLPAEDRDEAASIRRLALTGAATTMARTIGVRAVGLLLNVFLARLLAPRDFGELALGLTIYTAFSVFANAGLGASIIRRQAPPEAIELATVFGAQLALGMIGLVILTGLAVALGSESLFLGALFLACIPIQAPRTAALIELERRLDYKRLAIVGVVDSLCQTLFVLALVLGGFGVYGVALGQPLGVIAGTMMMLGWRVVAWHRPRFARHRARALLADGILFGASDATNMARDLTVNWCTAAIAGVSVLGTWTLTMRLASIPNMAIQALAQVTYAAMPRLHAAGGSAQGVVIPTLRLTTVIVGAPAAVLAGASPQFVPLVLGGAWHNVANVLPLTCLAYVIAGPVSVASAGYLFALGRVRRVLCAQISHSLVMVALAVALLPRLGVVALGVASCGAGLTDSAILGTAALKGAKTSYAQTTGPLLLTTVAIGGASFTAAQSLRPSWPSLVLVAAATLAAYAAALRTIAPDDARRVWRLCASTMSRTTPSSL